MQMRLATLDKSMGNALGCGQQPHISHLIVQVLEHHIALVDCLQVGHLTGLLDPGSAGTLGARNNRTGKKIMTAAIDTLAALRKLEKAGFKTEQRLWQR